MSVHAFLPCHNLAGDILNWNLDGIMHFTCGIKKPLSQMMVDVDQKIPFLMLHEVPVNISADTRKLVVNDVMPRINGTYQARRHRIQECRNMSST